MQNPRAAFAATVLLVFLSGAVVGALAMNFGVHKGLHQVAFWTDPGKEISVHRLQKELDLTPAQTEQLKSHPRRFRPLLSKTSSPMARPASTPS